MTATFKRIIITAIALIAIAGIACAAVLSGGCSTSAESSPIEGAKNGVVNTVIDISGVKSHLDAELHDKADEIAEELGIPQSMADTVVDSLAVEDWKATSLPLDATETGTYAVEADGVSALVTTYDDPSIVTIKAYGQSVTMAVPLSAQTYVPFVKYLEYIQ